MEQNQQVTPHVIWKPTARTEFIPDLASHAPFIVTQQQQRSDLGFCIISTQAPYLVCKIHSFRTSFEPRENDEDYNRRNRERCDQEEQVRMEWLNQRYHAILNGKEASEQGISVRELIESQGRIYDQEFDEPRMVIKIPGLNAYLELMGSLTDQNTQDWFSDGGCYSILNKMAVWAQNIWDRADRRARLSRSSDFQPVDDWVEDYDPSLRPLMPRKVGLGLTFVDPSRRPDYAHVYTPRSANQDPKIVIRRRQQQIDDAEQGIRPDNYGK